RERAQWWLLLSLRQQGRLKEALALARSGRAGLDPENLSVLIAMEAQILFESGQPKAASVLYDSIARHPPFPAWQTGKIGRFRAWRYTHLSDVLAESGDTTRLNALADTIESSGRNSAYGRDAKLHEHVRGLLLRARTRDAEAETALRRSVFSWTAGYTRTNYEL